jgi:hypothetical protein
VKVVRSEPRIRALGATAVFVAFDEPDALRRGLLRGVESPFPVVVDQARSLYATWGLRRAPWWHVWLDPKVWRQYAALLRAGERLRRLGSDPQQLGGDFVVDAGGLVTYSRPQRRDDRPPVGTLLEALRASSTL